MLVAALSIGTAGGCGGPAPKDEDAPVNETPSNTAVIGNDWDELVVLSGGSEIKISTIAHYRSSWNPCTRQLTAGILTPPELANSTIAAINEAMKEPLVAAEYCLPADQIKNFESYADILVNDKKESLFIRRGSEMCTKIRDRAVATQLMQLIDRAIVLVFKEACPNTGSR